MDSLGRGAGGVRIKKVFENRNPGSHHVNPNVGVSNFLYIFETQRK